MAQSNLGAQMDKVIDFISQRMDSRDRIRSPHECEIAVLAFSCIIPQERTPRMFLNPYLKNKLEISDENFDDFFHDFDNAVKRLRNKGELYSVEERGRGVWQITPRGKRRFKRDCPSLFNALSL